MYTVMIHIIWAAILFPGQFLGYPYTIALSDYVYIMHINLAATMLVPSSVNIVYTTQGWY